MASFFSYINYEEKTDIMLMNLWILIRTPLEFLFVKFRGVVTFKAKECIGIILVVFAFTP